MASLYLTCGLLFLAYANSQDFRDRREPDFNAIDKIGEKIVGGVPMPKNEWPWLVSIGISFGTYHHMCGGSIISENKILSAAHCFIKYPQFPFKVRAGEYELNVDDGTEQERTVTNIAFHPNYNTTSFENDVVVMTLNAPLTLNAQVNTIDLNDQAACPTDGLMCTVAGWGKLEYNGAAPKTPMKVSVPVISSAKCVQAYHELNPTLAVSGDIHVCAVTEKGGQDACAGDSGGPFVCTCGDKQVQAGIVSWGVGCARPDAPGVYARVSRFMEFIKSN